MCLHESEGIAKRHQLHECSHLFLRRVATLRETEFGTTLVFNCSDFVHATKRANVIPILTSC